MLTKRIIPCLDIKDGRTVKGVNFINIRDAGDPVELGAAYAKQGADELVFLDISATNEQRKTFAHLVKEIARHINIPFTVGGGISSVADVAPLLEAGADKVSVNSSAVRNPQLIDELSKAFGAQCIVLAIDARKIDNQWIVHTHGGKNPTDKKLFTWAKEGQERGALAKLHHMLNIPVIASGGAGNMGHFIDTFVLGKADAALAASIFHFGEIKIPDLKSFLHAKNINVRL